MDPKQVQSLIDTRAALVQGLHHIDHHNGLGLQPAKTAPPVQGTKFR